MPEYVWGRNAILETLRSSRQVKRILIAKGHRDAPVIEVILHEAERRHIPIEPLPRQRLDDLSQGAVHQGCIAVVEGRKYATLEQIIKSLARQLFDENMPPFSLVQNSLD